MTLLSELDSRAAELGVASYGISVTTLEEVFLKVGHGDDADGDDAFDRASASASASSPPLLDAEGAAAALEAAALEAANGGGGGRGAAAAAEREEANVGGVVSWSMLDAPERPEFEVFADHLAALLQKRLIYGQ